VPPRNTLRTPFLVLTSLDRRRCPKQLVLRTEACDLISQILDTLNGGSSQQIKQRWRLFANGLIPIGTLIYIVLNSASMSLIFAPQLCRNRNLGKMKTAAEDRSVIGHFLSRWAWYDEPLKSMTANSHGTARPEVRPGSCSKNEARLSL